MSDVKKMRLGLIGAGLVAKNYAEAAARCSSAVFAAVMDVNLQAAQSLADILHCPAYDNLERMANESQLDAVVVCTPPIAHQEACHFFMQRNVHVLCEKPLTLNGRLARTMLDCARHHGVILTMASKFRHVEDVIRAKKLIRAGAIGEIGLYENAFMSEVDMSKRWNSDANISGGGVLIDNGTHSVDIMRYLLGPVASVRVIEEARHDGLPVEDTVHICARTELGTVGKIDLSWAIKNNSESFIRVYGSQGTLEIGWKQSRYRCSLSDDWVVFGNGYDKLQAFANQIDDFCDAISGAKRLRVTEADMLASVDVIEAGYRSLRSGSWVAVKDVIPRTWEIQSPIFRNFRPGTPELQEVISPGPLH